jgi:hypothetical protein
VPTAISFARPHCEPQVFSSISNEHVPPFWYVSLNSLFDIVVVVVVGVVVLVVVFVVLVVVDVVFKEWYKVAFV